MTTFDDSLPALVDLVAGAWGSGALALNVFLRDALGRLTLVVLEPGRTGPEREALSAVINARLGGYADPSGISVATPEEMFDEGLRAAGLGLSIPVASASFTGTVRVVDRRVVGADWLRRPGADSPSVPRLFFVSLKGGVGRSTALCVLAAHLAAGGRRVLAIDLDLEAPGLGTMLLDEVTRPRFGLLDYLVETNLVQVGDDFVRDMLGASPLGGGRGSITVVPALGGVASASPMNVLGKLARAYLPSEVDPALGGFTAKIDGLINRLTAPGDYDVVLVDARAGLHESTAAAVVALQGNTLIFGMNQPQTFAGYRALLAQQALTLGPDWAARIHIVEARVGADGPSDDFISSMTEIFPDLHEAEASVPIALDDLRGTFEVEWTDEPTVDPVDDLEIDRSYILESDVFARFDPLKNPERLSRGIYAAVYGPFLQMCDDIVQSADATEGNP